ncbi:MAG: NAD(P)H-binding protein [Phenylobacterium sp.]|uniref:DoxX-like family protein n=1 Tax=Phenylobacterium sp. TaxID=1871053 RepID=UPI001A4083B5|nr:DoxX-like family protein [Phenylobacterium sp.]MBL8553183.1 NAD(P)H-binding protein [Phenylobacterium sp.]
MRVLLTGATGLIGSAVLARLQADGHEVWAVARRPGPATARLSPARWITLDVGRAVRPADWAPFLDGVGAVVNCAGVLQDSGADSTTGVHRDGPAALFAACEAAGVRRVVQVSAMGAGRQDATAFARSKAEGDARLAACDLDWVILHPAVVVGRAAYGGSALMRALAALPWLPEVRDAGPVQFVQVDDVAATAAWALRDGAPSRMTLELAAREPLTFGEAVATYRRWLGHPPAGRAPGGFLMPLAFRLGDAAGLLGWRPPIRSTARRELAHGVAGDPSRWMALTGIAPRTLGQALAAEPASVQERWFANLYLMKAGVLAILALFWIATGAITLGPGLAAGRQMLADAGAGALAAPLAVGGGVADILIGAGIAARRTARAAIWTALALALAYLAAGTLLAPQLWAEPLGPLTKILPIVALHLVALAILEDR